MTTRLRYYLFWVIGMYIFVLTVPFDAVYPSRHFRHRYGKRKIVGWPSSLLNCWEQQDWHTKEGWGGYSFDQRIFPIPSDAMGVLKHEGMQEERDIWKEC